MYFLTNMRLKQELKEKRPKHVFLIYFLGLIYLALGEFSISDSLMLALPNPLVLADSITLGVLMLSIASNYDPLLLYHLSDSLTAKMLRLQPVFNNVIKRSISPILNKS